MCDVCVQCVYAVCVHVRYVCVAGRRKSYVIN